MNNSFGGIGVEIMMHRTEFEIEIERVGSLMKQIGEQKQVVARSLESLSENYLQKILSFGVDLHKGAAEYGSTLIKCHDIVSRVRAEIATLDRLMAECIQAQKCADNALPDYAAFTTNGRLDVVPGRQFFLTAKNAGGESAGAAPFALPAHKQSIDPTTTLGDVQLARRFSAAEKVR